MTVTQLIAKLKKMPQGAKVYLQDHDHSDYEVNGPLNSVSLYDFTETPEDADPATVERRSGMAVMLRA